jgi:hypothetical protein
MEALRGVQEARRGLAARGRGLTLAAGAALTAGGWAVLWSVDTYWNPLAFTALWTGLALTAWGLSPAGYPGVRRHLWLAALSAPLWWWFELVNARVGNWNYVYTRDLNWSEQAVFSTVAFTTVVPALVAVSSALSPLFRGRGRGAGLSATASRSPVERSTQWKWSLTAAALLQAAVFAFPEIAYPGVWVAPFLLADGLLEWRGQAGLITQLRRRQWREAALFGAAGLVCGVLWEFWNYWSMPKWEYDVPLLGFWKVFEMPLLGYGGYVPFAWSVLLLVRLLDHIRVSPRS